MKIFKVDFEPIYPVGCCLIIAAKDIYEATDIAKQTVLHNTEIKVSEVDVSKSVVIEYMSGGY